MSQKGRRKAEPLVVVWTRLPKVDLEELRRRESATGSPVAWQIRQFVREGLTRKKGMIA